MVFPKSVNDHDLFRLGFEKLIIDLKKLLLNYYFSVGGKDKTFLGTNFDLQFMKFLNSGILMQLQNFGHAGKLSYAREY